MTHFTWHCVPGNYKSCLQGLDREPAGARLWAEGQRPSISHRSQACSTQARGDGGSGHALPRDVHTRLQRGLWAPAGARSSWNSRWAALSLRQSQRSSDAHFGRSVPQAVLPKRLLSMSLPTFHFHDHSHNSGPSFLPGVYAGKGNFGHAVFGPPLSRVRGSSGPGPLPTKR